MASTRGYVVIWLITSMWCLDARADVTRAAYGSGHHWGLGVRVSTGGNWQMDAETTPSSEDQLDEGRSEGVLGTNPGVVTSWEYLNDAGFSFGAALAAHFYSAGRSLPESRVGVAVQLHPTVSYYFSMDGHVRPYAKCSLGPSYVFLSDMLEKYEKYNHTPKKAFAISGSGAIGALILSGESSVGLFIELGIEGVMFWAKEMKYKSPDGEHASVSRSGDALYLLVNFGLAF
jgi:hypothetical protein